MIGLTNSQLTHPICKQPDVTLFFHGVSVPWVTHVAGNIEHLNCARGRACQSVTKLHIL